MFDPAPFSAFFRVVDSSVPMPMNQFKQIVAPNASRILLIINGVTTVTNIGISTQVNANVGIPVTNSLPFIADYNKWGAAVGLAWSGFTSAPAATLYVIEVIANSKQGDQ